MATTCTKSTAVSTATTSSSTSGRSREGTRGPTRRPMTSFSASGPGPGSLLIPTGAVIFSLLSYGVALRRPESGPTGQQRPPAFSSLLLFKAPETGPLPRSNVVRPLHASERHTAVRSFLLQVGHSQRNATRTPPHTVSAGRRHSFVTMLDAGVDLRDVQFAARLADPRTTMRYDRARNNLDRHPNYILAAYMASDT